MKLFDTIKAPGAVKVDLCDYQGLKALPGDKPSEAIGVTARKGSPRSKGPGLSFSQPGCITMSGFLKHRFPNVKLFF